MHWRAERLFTSDTIPDRAIGRISPGVFGDDEGHGNVGGRPFDDLGRHITQDELRALSESYKRVAGFALDDATQSNP
jgi:hypothetical protein